MVAAGNSVSLGQRGLWIGNTIFHQVVGIVTIFIFWLSFKNYEISDIILWHIVLCAGAYIPLMAEGIILFSGDNLWSQELERPKKYWVHGLLLGISIVAVSFGIGYEIHSKSEAGRPHFRSNHAITGLVSWVLALLSIFIGLFSWHSQRLKGIARPVIFKFAHNFLGIACYTIGVASLCLGVKLGAFSRLVTDNEQQTTLALIGIVTSWSLLAALKSAYNQLKDTFS